MFRSFIASVALTAVVGAGALVWCSTSEAAPPATNSQLVAYIDNIDQAQGVGQNGVQLLDASTGLTQTLIPDTAALAPSLSPDGRTLMYGVASGGIATLNTVPVDGSAAPTPIDTGGCSTNHGVWSPDGSLIVLNSSCGLLVLDATTDQIVRHPGGDLEYPTFDADGTHVLLSTGGGTIMSYALTDGSFTTLGTGIEPVASPDGTAIAYRSVNDPPANQGLWLMNADGSNPHELPAATPDAADDVTSLAWAADSATIMASVNPVKLNLSQTNNDLYAVSRSGTFRRSLTTTSSLNEDNVATASTTRPAEARGDLFTPLSRVRVLDTRSGLGGTKAAIGPGASRVLKVTGLAGVATDATAVTVNVFAIDPSTNTWLAVQPAVTGTAPTPTGPTLTALAGQVIANGGSVPVGANGSIRIYNHAGTVNVAIDITGYYTG